MYCRRDLVEVVTTTARFLAFRSATPDLKRLGPLYLALGLAVVWLVGIVRHIGMPNLTIWQYLGFDSVAYIFILAAILWLIVWPLRPQNWSYFIVLIFVTMTAAPAILYGLAPALGLLGPSGEWRGDYFVVDAHWYDRSEYAEYVAQRVRPLRLLLLLVVASWRVGLLSKFLSRSAKLGDFAVLIGTLLPLSLIVTTLAFLNLDKAVFDAMGGKVTGTPEDNAYAVLVIIVVLSFWASPLLLIGYVWQIVAAFMRGRKLAPARQ